MVGDPQPSVRRGARASKMAMAAWPTPSVTAAAVAALMTLPTPGIHPVSHWLMVLPIIVAPRVSAISVAAAMLVDTPWLSASARIMTAWMPTNTGASDPGSWASPIPTPAAAVAAVWMIAASLVLPFECFTVMSTSVEGDAESATNRTVMSDRGLVRRPLPRGGCVTGRSWGRRLVVGLVVAAPVLWAANLVAPWLGDGRPPSLVLPELVRDHRFDVAAWDGTVVEDDLALLAVTVRLDCAELTRSVYFPAERSVRLAEVVPGEVLANALKEGSCTLAVAVRDRGPRLEAVTESRTWIVYPSGELVVADGVRSDRSPPVITWKGSSAVIRDDVAGVARAEVHARCGGGAWSLVRGEQWPGPEERVELRPWRGKSESALPWTGDPGPCEVRVRAWDHAGQSSEVVARWYRWADAAVPEAELLADLVPPVLEGHDWSTLRLADMSGIREVRATVTCDDLPAVQEPVRRFAVRVRELPIADLLPRFEGERCTVELAVEDHAGRSARHVLEVRVDRDGRPYTELPRGDGVPPVLLGHVGSPQDLLTAAWSDRAPGLASVLGRVSCGADAPFDLPQRTFAPPQLAAEALAGPLPRLRGMCRLFLAAIDGEGLAATHSVLLFGYPDGTVVPADRVEETRRPELLGLDAALADRRVTSAEWSALAVVDAGSGLASVRVALDCRGHREVLVTRNFDGPVDRLQLSELLPWTPDRGRCALELFATDHAGNVLVTEQQRGRFE